MEFDLSIFRYPKILVLHLKRFKRSPTGERRKLLAPVELPKLLDMTPYAPHSQHESKARASKYELYGIIHHFGNMKGGHYIGKVKNVDSKKWYRCNDQ